MSPIVREEAVASKQKKLLEQIRDLMRLKHYSLRTERCYCDWIERFIRFHAQHQTLSTGEKTPGPGTGQTPMLRWRHPSEMGEPEVTAFLTHLARVGNVAASTQNQALSALLFLYKGLLKQEIGWLKEVERAKKPARLPVVLTRDEVHKVFANLHGTSRLMAALLYGSGLRLLECARLRVHPMR